mgnify:CR=1 FL=1
MNNKTVSERLKYLRSINKKTQTKIFKISFIFRYRIANGYDFS